MSKFPAVSTSTCSAHCIIGTFRGLSLGIEMKCERSQMMKDGNECSVTKAICENVRAVPVKRVDQCNVPLRAYSLVRTHARIYLEKIFIGPYVPVLLVQGISMTWDEWRAYVQHPPNTKLSMKLRSTRENATVLFSGSPGSGWPFCAFAGTLCLRLGPGEGRGFFWKARLVTAALAWSLRRSAGVRERDLRASMCTGTVKKRSRTRMLE